MISQQVSSFLASSRHTGWCSIGMNDNVSLIMDETFLFFKFLKISQWLRHEIYGSKYILMQINHII